MDDDSRVEDYALAAHVAELAGQALLHVRDDARANGIDPAHLGELGDRLSHRLMSELLAELRPGDPVLSEEGVDDSRRLEGPRVWIIDPIDGTREFTESGRGDWAVHVALVEHGDVVAGAVALPARSMVFSTARPPSVPGRPESQRPRLVVSRTRPPAETAAIRRSLDAELMVMGSAGAKAMAVVLGEADIYVHSGGQYEWDSAAPAGVAAAAGLHVSRLDGSRLVYNQPDPRLPDLLICRPQLVELVLAAARGGGP